MAKIKPAGKFAILALLIGALILVVTTYGDKIGITGGSGASGGSSGSSGSGDDVITIAVNTWGGFAPGQYFNEGFAASEASRFKKEYGITVEFKLMDDFQASRDAFKSGDVDLLWATADAFTTEAKGLVDAGVKPKIIFQTDWSRGGDVVVATSDIRSMQDLRGKRVACALGAPSHTLLLSLLEAAGMTPADIEVVQVNLAPEAAAIFKSGEVKAAVVWSPDDQDCLKNVAASHVLASTENASHLIADVLVARADYIDSHRDDLVKLVEGWMKGAAELNAGGAAEKKAAQILAAGMKQPVDYCENALRVVRLTTYGDNRNFFGLSSTYTGMTGEELYKTMARKFQQVGYIKEPPPSWDDVSDPSIIKALKLSESGDQMAEGGQEFKAVTVAETKAPALATKNLTINFPSGSAILDMDAQRTIKEQFGGTAAQFANMKIRVEGNTDNVGNAAGNKALSRRRAQSVADYLAREYGWSSNRFIVVGNGPDKPVADNGTEEGKAANRRTDMELVEAQ